MVSGFVWNIFPLSMRFKFSARSFGNRNLEDALSLFHLEQSDFFLSNFEYRYIYKIGLFRKELYSLESDGAMQGRVDEVSGRGTRTFSSLSPPFSCPIVLC